MLDYDDRTIITSDDNIRGEGYSSMSSSSDVDGCKIKWSWQELENITVSFVCHKNNQEFYLKAPF